MTSGLLDLDAGDFAALAAQRRTGPAVVSALPLERTADDSSSPTSTCSTLGRRRRGVGVQASLRDGTSSTISVVVPPATPVTLPDVLLGTFGIPGRRACCGWTAAATASWRRRARSVSTRGASLPAERPRCPSRPRTCCAARGGRATAVSRWWPARRDPLRTSGSASRRRPPPRPSPPSPCRSEHSPRLPRGRVGPRAAADRQPSLGDRGRRRRPARRGGLRAPRPAALPGSVMDAPVALDRAAARHHRQPSHVPQRARRRWSCSRNGPAPPSTGILAAGVSSTRGSSRSRPVAEGPTT